MSDSPALGPQADDLPAGFDVSSLNSAMLRHSGPYVAEPEKVHNGETGQTEQHVIVTPEPVEEWGDQNQPPPVVDPDDGDAAIKSLKDKRFRFNEFDEQEQQVIITRKQNPGMSLADAMDRVYGKDAMLQRYGKAAPAGEKTAETPAAPVLSPVEAAEAKIDTLQGKLDGLDAELEAAKAAYDYAEEERLTAEIKALKPELRTAEKEFRTALKTAPATTPQTPVKTDFEQRVEADMRSTLAMLADAGIEGTPLNLRMKEIHAELEAAQDDLIYSPSLNSTLALRAAAELGITPAVVQKKPPVTRSVPGPATTTQRRAETPAIKPVDERQLATQLTSADLERMRFRG